MEYLPDGLPSLAPMNQAVDAGTRRAGRAPSAVRGLLNFGQVSFSAVSTAGLSGPPSVWMDRLTDLALHEGISVFRIGTDDLATTTKFVVEVAPVIKEAVARERRP